MEMDGVNGQMKTRDHTLVDIEDEPATQQIVTAMKKKQQRVSRLSKHRCIYRVPKSLRDINEAAYVPRLVSLGPFHHGNENLKAMEEQKWTYFIRFIEDNNIDLDDLVRFMKKHEKKTREFYSECIALPSAQFVEVMLVDAIFVINLLLETQSSCSTTSVISIYDEDFFRFQVFRDMLLLENQLPFFILQKILDFVKSTNGTTITEERSITELTRCCINNTFMKKEGVPDLNGDEVMHFVDFLSFFYMPEETEESPQDCKDTRKMERTKTMTGPHKAGVKKLERTKSMTELHKAGVRFMLASTKTLLDIKFNNGVLEIPQIDVFDSTETIFRNLLAYDQCHNGSLYISDYFVLMGMLIDTPDDVELLVKNKILKNKLATKQEVSKVFNNLEREVLYYEEDFYYSDLCHQINKFCDIPRHKWMATLKQNYLDTPWKVISVIAASILLVLTVIQTVLAIIKP